MPHSSSRLATALLVVAVLAACSGGVPDLLGRRIPEVALDAYQRAAAAAPDITDGCRVDWQVLAGLGRVESNHGRSDGPRTIAANGDVRPPVRGLALDGSSGRQRILDTDGGAGDGDAEWDRAMGPLQFLPTTWAELGRDGNGDGVADPDNIYDAALTAAAHLCLREPGDYADRAALRRALVAYNASGAYADEVLDWVARYRDTPIDELVISSASAAPGGS
ncbi:MAG: lytic transglycosylase domain-containing protein [Chloroflexota bacterium]